MGWHSGRRGIVTVYGAPLNEFDIHEGADDIRAVLADDRLVLVNEYMRVTAGAAGTGENSTASISWGWDSERPGPKGIYDLVVAFPLAVKRELDRRVAKKIPYKRWKSCMDLVPYQLFEDDEFAKEILEDGVEAWVREAKFY